MQTLIPSICGFLLAIPLAHFILHAFLSYWRKHILAYYLFSILLFAFVVFICNLVIAPEIPLFSIPNYLLFIAILTIIVSIIIALISLFSLGIKRFLLLAVLKPDAVQQKTFYPGLYKLFPHPAYLAYFCIATASFLILPTQTTFLAWLLFVLTMPMVVLLEEHELNQRTKKGTQ
jgi:protein-S-isoprenylcysteine O-methyltransferase Ste14